jgi:hypothetical protein
VFAPVSLEMLVDSPLDAGINERTFDLGTFNGGVATAYLRASLSDFAFRVANGVGLVSSARWVASVPERTLSREACRQGAPPRLGGRASVRSGRAGHALLGVRIDV